MQSKKMGDMSNIIATSKAKEPTQRIVTISLKIGDDGDTLPLFIGKKGKNLKYIKQYSGLNRIWISNLIRSNKKYDDLRDDEMSQAAAERDDSITMRGTQQQLENALRASREILERIGKWYDKRKLKLLNDALREHGDIKSDIHTIDRETFKTALSSIPGIDTQKLFQSIDKGDKGDKKRMLSFIWNKFQKNPSQNLNPLPIQTMVK